jgi:hypothetical protein
MSGTLQGLTEAAISAQSGRSRYRSSTGDTKTVDDGWVRKWRGWSVKGRRTVSTHPDDAASIGDATFKLYLTQRVSHPDVSTTV